MRRLAALLLALGLALPAAAAEVVLRAGDLVPLGPLGFIAPRLAVPPPDPGLPVISAKPQDPAAVALRNLAGWRRAAGFAGVVYDNRDRGHSLLPADLFPGLARLAYAPDLMARGLDYGLGGAILMPAIVLGNSSTAIRDGPLARSLGRHAMTAPGGPEQAFRTYAANHVYIYPEHRDHDAVDLYPANWPYMVTSQGSSGSDRPFLRAIALTLAAFRPATRERLVRAGLVAPTVQMILRRSQVDAEADYFSAQAHPAAFAGKALRPERMVAMAAGLAPDAIPPLVRLTMETEGFVAAAGLAGLSERLFDTPSAIARVWRGPAFTREMVVSAAETADPNGRALRFRWALLRGDPARVRIEPLDDAGTRARLTLDWQEARAVPGPAPDGSAGRTSARVDIAVFALNGAGISAPAFVSVSFPVHEVRRYEAGPDGAMRLVRVDYDALGRKAPYDPMLHWSAPWADRAVYGPTGDLEGWIRERTSAEGAATGERVPAGGAAPYAIDRRRPARPVLVAPD